MLIVAVHPAGGLGEEPLSPVDGLAGTDEPDVDLGGVPMAREHQWAARQALTTMVA